MNHRGLTTFFLVTLFGSLFVTKVHAQIVVNEFCPKCDPEWVELYNLSSTTSVDLEGWEIKDSNNQSNDDITITSSVHQSTVISPLSFLVFERPKGWLNDTSPWDTVQLFDSSDNLIDSYSYSSPQDDKTFSRVPDGSGAFQANTSPTKSSYNQALPTPTATPTPTSSPTSTPTLVPTPTPTRTPTPTKTQSPSPNPTPTPKPSPTSTDTAEDSPLETGSEPLVLGSTQEEPSPSVDSPDSAPPSRSLPYLPVIALVLGSLLLLTSAFFLANKYLLKAKDDKMTQ